MTAHNTTYPTLNQGIIKSLKLQFQLSGGHYKEILISSGNTEHSGVSGEPLDPSPANWSQLIAL